VQLAPKRRQRQGETISAKSSLFVTFQHKNIEIEHKNRIFRHVLSWASGQVRNPGWSKASRRAFAPRNTRARSFPSLQVDALAPPRGRRSGSSPQPSQPRESPLTVPSRIAIESLVGRSHVKRGKRMSLRSGKVFPLPW
jgi:hypothetical protein